MESPKLITAPEILDIAAETMVERGRDRDTPEGERSMARAVAIFKAKFDIELTEQQGWEFMICLKEARAAQGAYRFDDYLDRVAYAALSAEASVKVNTV